MIAEHDYHALIGLFEIARQQIKASEISAKAIRGLLEQHANPGSSPRILEDWVSDILWGAPPDTSQECADELLKLLELT